MRRSLRHIARADFVRHGAVVLSASLVTNGCNYVFHILNSRRLGVVGYGELASLVAVLALLSFPATALSLAVAKIAAELHAVDDRAGIRRLVDVLMRWGAFSGTGLIALALVTLPWSTVFFRIDDRPALILTAAAVALSLLLPVMRAVLQGADDFNAFACSTMIEGGFKLALGVGLTYAGYGIDGAICGILGGSVFATIYSALALRPHVAAQESRLSVNLRRLVETAAGVGVASLSVSVLSVADVVAAKHFLSPQSAGLYGALALVGKIFLFAVGFIPQVVLPKVARRNAAGRSSTHYLLYSVIAVASVGVIGLGICAVAPWFIIRTVAGAAFAPIAPLLLPYAAAMTSLAIANVAATYRIGAHRLGFGAPLIAVVAAELIAFTVWHDSPGAIVRVVMVGHVASAVVTLYGATGRLGLTSELPADAAA